MWATIQHITIPLVIYKKRTSNKLNNPSISFFSDFSLFMYTKLILKYTKQTQPINCTENLHLY